MNADNPITSKITQELDRCVSCGLCLPHCPTYQLTHREAESPRGRISLMSALWRDKLPLNTNLEQHLDNCLACRACESVCPSGVPYGHLIDTTRQAIEAQQPPTGGRARLRRLLLTRLAPSKAALTLIGILLRLYQWTGLQWLVTHTSLLKPWPLLARLNGYLLPLSRLPWWRPYYAPTRTTQGEVLLFTGCITAQIDTQTLRDTIQLLTRVGYGVTVPPQQRCCGALHQHNGDIDTATSLISRNSALFNQHKKTVISTASGCTAMLHDYPHEADAPPRLWQAADICQFLSEHNVFQGHTFRPLKERVIVHEPCSLRHLLHQQQHVYTLLNKIPD
ncbi:MAG: hypothetical protein FD130_1148, partial [Halothiobacillaceae bacterium]